MVARFDLFGWRPAGGRWLWIVLLLALGANHASAQGRTLTEADRELLEQRIEALERRLDDTRGTVRPLTEDQLRPVTEQVRRLDEKIDGRTWAFSIVTALVLALAALAGFLLNYFGRPALVRWIQQTVEDRATAEVQERLSGASIPTLVQAQAGPGIEAVVDDLRAEGKARIEAAQAEHERQLEAQRAALQVTSTPSEERTATVSDLIESQRQSNPNPEDWGALDWVLRARHLSDQGRHDEALAALDRAIELEPDNEVTLHNRGVALNELGRYDEALAALDRALELRPDDPVTLNNRGWALDGLDRYDEALAALDRALELAPDDPVMLSNRGRALDGLGRYDEALAALDRALELRPDNPVTLSNRGLALNGLGRHDEALAAFNRSIELGPVHPAGYYGRSRALIGAGDAEEALRAADKSLALADEDPWRDFRRTVALYYRAVALRMLGHPTETAKAALDDALAAPFTRSLATHIIDPAAFDDPRVGAFVSGLNDRLRAHDAARDL